jgi:hypothetical protein
MPPLRDDCELSEYKAVLELAERFRDYIIWKKEPAEAVRCHLTNYSQREVELLICKHRHEVCQTKCNRDYPEPYHYDFRVPTDIEPIYIETVFVRGSTIESSRIRVVRVKPVDPAHTWIG